MVIPAFRAAATIRRAIDSVLAQTLAAAEIIVVDDGSPDDQATLVENEYGRRVTVVRKANGGAASARNAGIDRATGDYIAFLDADDYWEPQKLARQLGSFQEHPDLGLAAGAFFVVQPGAGRPAITKRPGPRGWYDRILRFGGLRAFRLATRIFTSTVVLRRGSLGRERFSPDLTTGEDRDLWARIVSRFPTFLTSEPVATAVLIEGSLSRSSIETDCTSMLQVVERNQKLLGKLGTRVWRSHTLYRWAAVDPDPTAALPRLLHSLAIWPLPYAGLIDGPALGRTKRLILLLQAAAHRRFSSIERTQP